MAAFSNLANGVFNRVNYEPTSKATNIEGVSFGSKGVTFSLSLSNSIFGSSTKVQPRSCYALIIIKA